MCHDSNGTKANSESWKYIKNRKGFEIFRLWRIGPSEKDRNDLLLQKGAPCPKDAHRMSFSFSTFPWKSQQILLIANKPLNIFLGRVERDESFHWLDFGKHCRGDVIWDPELVQLQLEGLFVGVQSHFKEREGHGEDHPYVDHLDIRGGGQGAWYANEAEIIVNSKLLYLGLKICWDTYNVAKTSRTVRLTMMTMSMYLWS